MLSKLANLELYADGADLAYLKNAPSWVDGFTTNPSLLRAAGVTDYRKFAQEAVAAAGDKPISFEVIADDGPGILNEAYRLASWGDRVYVKVPIVRTDGTYNTDVIRELVRAGVKVNVTAVMTLEQIVRLGEPLAFPTPSIVSVFAGRIADTGVVPVGTVFDAVRHFWKNKSVKVLWASTRQVFSVREAIWAGCHIITMTPALIDKISLFDKDLTTLSRETVQQFRRDALASGLEILGEKTGGGTILAEEGEQSPEARASSR